ncbi:hypothetical protein Tco_0339578 [Tanacetum coccineum]
MDDFLVTNNSSIQKSSRHALFALSKIQKSRYGLLEVQFLVGQNLAESVEKGDRKQAHFCGGRISSRRKKSWGSNSGNGGNTEDGGKTIGGAIGTRSGGIASEAKRSLDKSSEGSEEVFPDEAGE